MKHVLTFALLAATFIGTWFLCVFASMFFGAQLELDLLGVVIGLTIGAVVGVIVAPALTAIVARYLGWSARRTFVVSLGCIALFVTFNLGSVRSWNAKNHLVSEHLAKIPSTRERLKGSADVHTASATFTCARADPMNRPGIGPVSERVRVTIPVTIRFPGTYTLTITLPTDVSGDNELAATQKLSAGKSEFNLELTFSKTWSLFARDPDHGTTVAYRLLGKVSSAELLTAEELQAMDAASNALNQEFSSIHDVTAIAADGSISITALKILPTDQIDRVICP